MHFLFFFDNSGKPYTAIHKSFINALSHNHQISCFEFLGHTSSRFLNKIIWKIDILKKYFNRRVNKKFKKKVASEKPDVLFIIKGNAIKSETLKKIRQHYPHLVLINYNPDSPFNTNSSEKEVEKSIALYDIYCTYSHQLVNQISNAGCKQVLYSPFAVDNKLIYPVKNEKYLYDISFIGNGDVDRQQKVVNLFANSSLSLNVFGKTWKKKPYLNLYTQRNGIEFLKTISQSKININLLRKQNEGSVNMRTFEIPAAGGFMFHEQSEEAMYFFKPDKEAVYFSSKAEFNDKAKFYLKNESIRLKILENGYNKSQLYEFSYKCRMKEVEKYLGDYSINK